MQTNEIKADIQQRIAIIDQSFSTFWGIFHHDEYVVQDISALNEELKKAKRLFLYFDTPSILLAAVLVIFTMLKFLKLIEFWNMNEAGILILFTVVFLVNRYRNYRIKVNLENKIYLLELMKKIGTIQ